MENFSTPQKSQPLVNQQTKNFFRKLFHQTTLHKIFFSPTPSPPHHQSICQSICQSIASIKPTSSTATTSPKNNAVRDGRLWQMFQATHKQASAIPSNPPLSPPAIQQESTKPQFFLKYYQSNHLKNYQQLFLK